MSVKDGNSVDHPPHYNVGNYEVIDVIEDWKLGFNLGNAIKYIARAGHKEKTLEDLKKAAWYLNREIENLSKSKTEKFKEAFTLKQPGDKSVTLLISSKYPVGSKVVFESEVMEVLEVRWLEQPQKFVYCLKPLPDGSTVDDRTSRNAYEEELKAYEEPPRTTSIPSMSVISISKFTPGTKVLYCPSPNDDPERTILSEVIEHNVQHKTVDLKMTMTGRTVSNVKESYISLFSND